MSNVNHTPGPWKIDKGLLVDAHGVEVAVRAGITTLIASTNQERMQTATANARLIAAAPETAAERDRLREINRELLEALKALLFAADEAFGEVPMGDAVEEARAAIAKAEEK